MNFKITVDGETGFYQAIGRFEGLVTDWRKVWPLCSEIFYRIEQEQFASEGARGGAKWKPLSPKYKTWKTLNYGDLPILYRTGNMKRSLLGIGADAIRVETDTSLALGTRANRKGFYYPVAHQRGTPKMGQRKPIDLSRNDYGKIVSRVFRYFNDGVEAVGFIPSRSRGARSIQAS